ncbi:hypothetical protein [Peristeroidobacter agariperforans]|uniref:hypothetical protein n=1 Tax=Peristeroidobacter agariperforans TaxID=268404 RepID=UPI00101CA417|nr:hypothetical protein [Peristeroidobacter agariperforans]
MTEPTDKVDEQQLDEYLKGDSSVSRQYRQLPGADVPPSLDRLVLRQAEDAVKPPSRPTWMRWTAPLAVAASAVLVVSIVIETGVQDETIVSAPVMQEKREAAAEAPTDPIETKTIEEPAYASADVPPPPKLDAPAPPPPAAAPAPAPEQSARAEQPVAHVAAEALLREPTPAAQANSAAFVANAERQKQALEEAVREQELSATQRAMRGDQADVAGPRDTVETPQPKAVLSYSRPISASADSMATLQKTYTDPEAWLKDIRQLRKDNKQEEADRQWRRFVAAFPNYEVAETDAAREAKK